LVIAVASVRSDALSVLVTVSPAIALEDRAHRVGLPARVAGTSAGSIGIATGPVIVAVVRVVVAPQQAGAVVVLILVASSAVLAVRTRVSQVAVALGDSVGV